MDATGLHLLIPDKADVERDAVAAAFSAAGGSVHRLARFWDPPAFAREAVRLYGADSFCLVLQQKLGTTLCSPDDELILRVPPQFLGRRIARTTLHEAIARPFPQFVKPLMPKQFRAAVYAEAATLAAECRGLPGDTAVLESEIVTFSAEARCFLHAGRVLDVSCYEGDADAADAAQLAADLAGAMELPHAVVLDLGYIVNRGWAVIEFNAAWGAGLNGCDATRVLPAILAASAPNQDG